MPRAKPKICFIRFLYDATYAQRPSGICRKRKFIAVSVTQQESMDVAPSRPVVASIYKNSHLFRRSQVTHAAGRDNSSAFHRYRKLDDLIELAGIESQLALQNCDNDRHVTITNRANSYSASSNRQEQSDDLIGPRVGKDAIDPLVLIIELKVIRK